MLYSTYEYTEQNIFSLITVEIIDHDDQISGNVWCSRQNICDYSKSRNKIDVYKVVVVWTQNIGYQHRKAKQDFRRVKWICLYPTGCSLLDEQEY